MAPTKFDARQTTSHDALDQVVNATGQELDDILRAANTELTPALRLTAAATPDLTVAVGNITITNSNTGRSHSIPPIGVLLPTFASGTVTFPASSGGNITFSTGGSTPVVLTVASTQYVKVLLYLDALGNLGASAGAAAASAGAAVVPPPISGTFSIGYVTLHNTGGTIDNVTNVMITQFAGGGGGSGGTGDTTEILETIKNDFVDSPYGYVTPSIAKVDQSALIGTYGSNWSYDLINSAYKLNTLTGGGSANDKLTSKNLLETSEYSFLDVGSARAMVAWKTGYIDTAATYEISRDGGGHFWPMTLTRIGSAGPNYVGDWTVPREEEDSATVTYAGSEISASTLSVNPTGPEAIGTIFQFSTKTRAVTLSCKMSRASGTSIGNFRFAIYDEVSSLPSTRLYSTLWQPVTSLGTSGTVISVTADFSFLQAATNYYFVIETDAAYKARYTLFTAESIEAKVASSGSLRIQHFNGTTWSVGSLGELMFAVVGGQESFVSQSAYAVSGSYKDLQTSGILSLAQPFVLTSQVIAKRIDLTVAKVGTPVGYVYAQIVKDDGTVNHYPSTNANDILVESAPVSANITAGVKQFSIPATALDVGTYHVVIRADATYFAASASNYIRLAYGTTSLPTYPIRTSTSPGSWGTVAGQAMTYSVLGRALDLRFRVTGGTSTKYLDAFAVYYGIESTGVSNGRLNIDVKQFHAVADRATANAGFAIAFLPDVDLLRVYHVETGQVYVWPSYTVQGYTVTFPTDAFYNGGVETDVTLVFDQTKGTTFDTSDRNAALLAANALGSTDASIDRSQSGRGIMLRRPDGTLREITIANDDSLVIYSV